MTRPISQDTLRLILNDSFYKKCARSIDGECDGRVSFEHVIIYGGRQLDEAWSIIPLCLKHHSILFYQDNGLLNKEINESIALNRANDDELIKISKVVDYVSRKHFLNEKYKNRYKNL